MKNPRKRCTLQDVADYCGLSRATVSQILNSRPGNYSSAATREKVRQAAQELGYLRSYGYQMMRGGKTGTIAILISQQRLYEAEYIQKLVIILSRKLSQYGKAGFLMVSRYTTEENLAMIRDLIARGAEGVIALGSPIGIGAVEAELRRNGIAFAGIGASWSRRLEYLKKEALRDAIVKFAADGFANFRLFWKYNEAPLDIFSGFPGGSMEELDAGHRVIMPDWNNDREPNFWDRIDAMGYELTRQVMTGDPSVNALFYQSDEMMLGGLRYLVDNNIAVGKTVRLCGMGDSASLRYNAFPLSSLAYDYETTCDSLLQLLEDEQDQVIEVAMKPVYRDEPRQK